MENGPYKWVGLYIYNLVAGPFILKNLIASFSVCRETGMYSALKVIYCLLLLKSLLWGNIVYTMELIVEVVIWDKLILCPRPREISTNQMIVDFMGAGLNLHTPQTTLLLKQVLLLVWSRYSNSFLPSLSLIHVHMDLLFLSFHIILSQLVLKWINLFTLISLFTPEGKICSLLIKIWFSPNILYFLLRKYIWEDKTGSETKWNEIFNKVLIPNIHKRGNRRMTGMDIFDE